MTRNFERMLGVALVLSCGIARAQSPDELLTKHVQARGGLEKLNAVQAVKMTGTITLIPLNEVRKAEGRAQELPVTLTGKRSNKVRLEMDSQGKKLIQGYDGGETAWGLRPDATEPDMLFDDEGGMGEMVALLMQDLADLEGPLVNTKDKWRTVQIEGTEGSGDAVVYQLKLSPRSGFVRHVLLDGKTFLIRQTTRSGSDFQMEAVYSDYRLLNGVQVPYSIEGKIEGETFARIRFEKAEVVGAPDDAMFQPPAQK
jgi:hypothetical protein